MRHDKHVSFYTVYFPNNTLTGALSHQHTGSSHCLNLLLRPSAEELGLDDHRLLGQLAFAQNFVVTLQNKKKIKKTLLVQQDNP